jgi:hypothetical protein
MSVDHLFDHWGDDHTDPSGTAWAGGTERWRVDLGRALTGLRHLRGSPEPGRVFSELAAVCVPAICDEMTIDVSEAGMHPYRIRRPAPSLLGVAAAGPSAGPMAAYGSGRVVLVGSTVTVTVGSLPCGGPDYTARLVGVWHTGYAPTEADATLLEVLADHASAVVHRERTTRGLTDPATAGRRDPRGGQPGPRGHGAPGGDRAGARGGSAVRLAMNRRAQPADQPGAVTEGW